MVGNRPLNRPVYNIDKGNNKLSAQKQQAADKGHIKPDIFYKAKSEENGRNSTVGYHHPLYPHGEHKGLYGLFLNRL